MPSRRDRGKMSFGLSCHPEPGLERCWPSFSSALWWWQPQQGWPRFSLCTSRRPRTGHRGQTEVRRFAFGILHPLPIPMGLLETERSAGIFPSESRSWRRTSEQQRPFKKICESCLYSCRHWMPSSSTYVEGNQPIRPFVSPLHQPWSPPMRL